MHEMVACGLPADRVIRCNYVSPFDAVRRRRNLPQFARDFAFAGSLMWHKAMYVLLAAFDEMPPGAWFSVAGLPGYDSAGEGVLYDADDPIGLLERIHRMDTESGLAHRLVTSSPPVTSMKDQVAERVGIYERIRWERGGRALGDG